jgi:hypothetical protein
MGATSLTDCAAWQNNEVLAVLDSDRLIVRNESQFAMLSQCQVVSEFDPGGLFDLPSGDTPVVERDPPSVGFGDFHNDMDRNFSISQDFFFFEYAAFFHGVSAPKNVCRPRESSCQEFW